MSSPRAQLVSTRWGTPGDLATGAFFLAALTGVALAVPFDPAKAYGSLAGLLLADAAGTFIRNLHYWSAQACLVLTLLHAWDHLRLGTEMRLGRGLWMRLSLTAPLLLFLMLSGFLLRGDADAQQALRIVSRILEAVPGAGRLASTLLFGRGGRLDVVYIHHAATATILVWLFVTEHARRLWPRIQSFLAAGAVSALLALLLTPGLHDGLDPVVKGPWYFLGLQEILHWVPWPSLALLIGALLLGALYAVREASPAGARRLKTGLLALGALYVVLTLVGTLFRGPGWSWGFNWPRGEGNVRAGWVFARTPAAPVPLPAVNGRPEGCLVCHANVTGLGDAHRPEALGCASCHGGDTLSLQKEQAHRGMRLIPGNLADARSSCGAAGCHEEVVERVDRSVMTTMSGVVDVDRQVLEGRPGAAPAFAEVARLKGSPADTHLRQLCASCHLGQPKTVLGPDNGSDPGGGCIACHLTYAPGAARALEDYQRAQARGAAEPPTIHPALTVAVEGERCFLCHSRSGRISTNYEGWMEMHDPPEALHATTSSRKDPLHRTLADDRVFERQTPDVHHEQGLECADCHTAKELMGDGVAHARKSGQARLACQDCHARPGAALASLPASALDTESRRLLVLHKWPGPAPQRFVRTGRGDALVNGIADAQGQAVLLKKRTGQPLPLKPQAAACAAPGHARLDCGACHTGWTASCTTCHTSFEPGGEAWDWVARADVKGAWREHAGPYEARPPTLGIEGSGGAERVRTFAPGMILSVDPPAAGFQRLYARTEPHTTRKGSRSCRSCHNDPEALGYGKGRLTFERNGNAGTWHFAPALAAGPDGLPQDAWIPFLGTRKGPVSTRGDVRPFSVQEQRRILEVGACLTCHAEVSAPMRAALLDYRGALRRRSPRCLPTRWE